MYDREKELWVELIDAYRNLSQLWDPKHKDYTNKRLRNQAYEKLVEHYKKIDSEGTLLQMKKRLDNMRTTFHRERKKQKSSLENGEPYTPSLWYYNNFSFLDETVEQLRTKDTHKHTFNFNRSNNKIYLEKSSPGTRNSKRKRDSTKMTPKQEISQGYINIEPLQSSADEEEDTRETSQPPQPKRRIFDLLQRQEKFIDSANRILTKKDQDWEVIGKAIGLQLFGLEGRQRTIANKLISDAIFYGSMGKLTVDSFVNVENYDRGSPESAMEHMDAKEEILIVASPSHEISYDE